MCHNFSILHLNIVVSVLLSPSVLIAWVYWHVSVGLPRTSSTPSANNTKSLQPDLQGQLYLVVVRLKFSREWLSHPVHFKYSPPVLYCLLASGRNLRSTPLSTGTFIVLDES
jgi:hypothetical protein